MMLLFKVTRKTKYALAAIRLHAQLNALLSPREAHSLRWNRTINLKGGKGRNVAIDQVQEHRIKETKELMSGHGANLTFPSAQIYSRASDGVTETMNNFDKENKVREESGKHKYRQDADSGEDLTREPCSERNPWSDTRRYWNYPKRSSFCSEL